MIYDESLGFQRASVMVDGKNRTVARFQCTKCDATEDIPIKTGDNLNIELLAKQAIQRGWQADSTRKSKCLCPDCQVAKANRANDPDSEIKKHEAKMKKDAPVIALRDMTADQRARVRELIEKHFDEDIGCYLDDYSDQRIAEDVGLPRLHVERLREAAYGPIRVSAEVVAMQREVAGMKQRIADQLSAAEALFEATRSELATLHEEVIVLEQKVSPASRVA